MAEIEIKKIEIKKKDGIVEYTVSGGKFKGYINIPSECSEDEIDITLSNKKHLKLPIAILSEALKIKSATKKDTKQYPLLPTILKLLDNDKDHLKIIKEYRFSKLKQYEDITDYEINSFGKIDQSTITSSGLWIGNGIRIIEYTFDDEMKNFTDSNKNANIKVSAFFDKKGNESIAKIRFEGYTKNDKYYIKLDTDKLSEHFTEKDIDHSFIGTIVISLKNNKANEASFSFLFKVKMTNPTHLSIHQKSNKVSIDFGTSSTCISFDSGKTLLPFSDKPKDIKDYENMTALILFNWERVYEQWKASNSRMPHILRSLNDADDVKIEFDYLDYGNKIIYELENAPESKTIDAIVMNLKSLPHAFDIDPNHKEVVKPFDEWKEEVYLTDKIGDTNENKETLNPIALYGYLIGRALNSQTRNLIYTKYSMTSPVSFNPYQKNRIKESLEYGIKRSLPKSVVEDLKFELGYSEPVALLGAAKKLKHLKIEKDYDATLFAVFDFGGGTLDFAFGLYREASEDKNIMIGEHEEDCDYKIEIFKTGGESVGGETLIDSLSWQIYKDNREIMEEKNIPIFVPENETKMDNYPSSLLGTRHIDKINLKSISEAFSREFLINGEITKTKVELSDTSDKKQEIELNVSRKDAYSEFIEEKILKSVKNFRKTLEDVLKDNKKRISLFGFKDGNMISKVKILKAGNTCKARWVETSFKEVFEDFENIIFLEDEKEKITPKNAVAKGALMFTGIKIHNHSEVEEKHTMPLKKFIWKTGEDEDDAEPLFKKGDNTKMSFQSIAKRDDSDFTISYSDVRTIEESRDLKSHTINIPSPILEDAEKNNKFDVWVKPYDRDVVEIVLANRKGNNMDETKKMLCDLATGDLIK